MKVVLQRVTEASVSVNSKICGKIDKGLVVLVGVTSDDTEEDIDYLVHKIMNMRIFEDELGKMNKSLVDNEYSILSISQFTLYAKTKKGNRPAFTDAAGPEYALKLYNIFNEKFVHQQVHLEKGVFGEHMRVSLVNDGPVTIVIDSKEK